MIRLNASGIKMDTPCVLTVGKFESVHLGHQKLFSEVLRLSKELNLPSGAVTFDPHPNMLFGSPDYRPLFTAAERAYIMEGLGLDYMLVFPFDAAFAAQSPEEFCAKLFNNLNAAAVVVGEGFRFGKNGAGTPEILRREAARHSAAHKHTGTNDIHDASRQNMARVLVIPHQSTDGGEKVSTSDIRKLITNRELEKAAEVMGFPFFIMGTVTHGKQIGRTMGFPTVNLLTARDKLLPPDGVYATRTFLGDKSFRSITNIGVRPTVQQTTLPGETASRTVESFLIGFNGDLYNTSLRTEFLRFIRPEKKFANIDELRAQITKDIESLCKRARRMTKNRMKNVKNNTTKKNGTNTDIMSLLVPFSFSRMKYLIPF